MPNIKNSITGADPIKLLFLRFPIFAVKLGHFIVDTFFYHTYQKLKLISEKRKNSSLAKKEGFIGSAPGVDQTKLCFLRFPNFDVKLECL